MPSVTDIVNGSKICEYLAACDVARGVLFGAPLNPKIAIQLYVERSALQSRYDYEDIAGGNLPSQELIQAANYVYSLWAKYGFYAIAVIVGGGTIPVINPPSGGGGSGFSRPFSVSYVATADGETFAPFSETSKDGVVFPTPSNAVIFKVVKSQGEIYSYTVSNTGVSLTNGLSLAEGEPLFFEYVVPL